MATIALRSATARHLALFRTQHARVVVYSPYQHHQRRHFFGLGEVLGVITNPAETLRQLNESRELLRKAKEDMELNKEAKQIPKKHTFSKLPGFHGRKHELELLRKVLSNAPKLNVIFGATSVGKTALLREVLATDDFFVIKFDLRISGFADLRTLYVALCEQFERFFDEMQDEEMDKQRLTFKHLNLDLFEKEKTENGGYQVSVADIASLMESLQSCLLRYWEYDPPVKEKKDDEKKDGTEGEANDKAATAPEEDESSSKTSGQKARVVEVAKEDQKPGDSVLKASTDASQIEEDQPEKVFKKRPIVFLMDEAHKLPALVDNPLSLKVFLDTLLVLTKQDRLCHVILSTSDSFFHHFLRSMNVGHHAQLLTIGDCTKSETQSYVNEVLLPDVPDDLKSKVNFEEIYDAFGGKLSHVSDYLSAWINASGDMTPYRSAIFTQAYTLLQFHMTHDKFETFSPLSTATSGSSTDDDSARFTRADLLHVMRRLVQAPYSIPYFRLCREVGTEQVDSMIKTRVLDLRWTCTVSPEQDWAERVWSQDGIERPIVLPMTRIVRRAMEVVLREEEEFQGADGAGKEEHKRKEDKKQAEKAKRDGFEKERKEYKEHRR